LHHGCLRHGSGSDRGRQHQDRHLSDAFPESLLHSNHHLVCWFRSSRAIGNAETARVESRRQNHALQLGFDENGGSDRQSVIPEFIAFALPGVRIAKSSFHDLLREKVPKADLASLAIRDRAILARQWTNCVRAVPTSNLSRSFSTCKSKELVRSELEPKSLPDRNGSRWQDRQNRQTLRPDLTILSSFFGRPSSTVGLPEPQSAVVGGLAASGPTSLSIRSTRAGSGGATVRKPS